MKQYLTHLSAMVSFGLLGCQSGSPLQGGHQLAKAEASDQQDQDLSHDGEDAVVPPQNISGTYLRCAYEMTPTADRPEAFVGCRFEDEDGQRVPAANLGEAYGFSYRLPDDSPLSVYARNLADDGRYDAVYLVFAGSATSLLTAMEAVEIYVSIQNEQQSQQDLTISGLFSTIKRDAESIPEAPSENYDLIRDEILLDAQNGSVTPPF